MANIKISGFYDEVTSDLKTQLEMIKSFGEEYLCPRNINGKSIAAYTAEEFEKDIKPMLDEYGVKFSSIGSPIGKIDLYDEEGYANQLKKLEELVKICKKMHCKYIRIFDEISSEKIKLDDTRVETIQKLKEGGQKLAQKYQEELLDFASSIKKRTNLF